MRIVLLTPFSVSHRTAEETLALGYLASILRERQHQVRVIDGWLRNVRCEELARIVSLEPVDVVAMSCYYSNLDQAAELLRSIRRVSGELPAICGGFGPTFDDETFLSAGFDVVVRGEGEDVVAAVIDRLRAPELLKMIPAISFRFNGEIVRTPGTASRHDLDTLPFPARDEIGWTIARRNPVHICTSRGCRANCAFCSVAAFARMTSRNAVWRQRSIDNIATEIEELQKRYQVTHLKIVDDSFIEPPRDAAWAGRFADELERRSTRVHFRTQVRADRLNEPLVAELVRAGWFATSIGIESGSPTALTRMRKAATLADNQRALKLLERCGIYVQAGMILFDADTTLTELEESYDFLRQQSWIITKGIFTELYAATGTPVTDRLIREGLAVRSDGRMNFAYAMRDYSARRVSAILRRWHISHARVYDWTTDALAAPKVLPREAYAAVHTLARRLYRRDLSMFRATLDHVCHPGDDDDFAATQIAESSTFYANAELAIATLYRLFSLIYDGASNPFLKAQEACA